MSKKDKEIVISIPPDINEPDRVEKHFAKEKVKPKRTRRPRNWSVQKENFYRQKYYHLYTFYKTFYPKKRICGLPVSRMESREVFMAFVFDKIQRTQALHKRSTNATQDELNSYAEQLEQNAEDHAEYMRTFLPGYDTYKDILNQEESIFVLELLHQYEYYGIVGYKSYKELRNEIIGEDMTFPSPIKNALNKTLKKEIKDNRDYYKKIVEADYYINTNWRIRKQKVRRFAKNIFLNLLFKKRKNDKEHTQYSNCGNCPILLHRTESAN